MNDIPDNLRRASEDHCALPSAFLPLAERVFAAVAELERLIDELRGERHRQDAVLAQLQGHEAVMRGLVERMEAATGTEGRETTPRPSRGNSGARRGI